MGSDNSAARWRFWIDRGGTFTDIVARDPAGRIRTHKLLSEDPERYDDAVTHGIRTLLGLEAGAPVAPELIDCVRMGTTVGTNALLERRGEPTVLAITRGFGDALAIGYQTRPKLFALAIEKPPPLYARVIEVDERVTAEGEILRRPDPDALGAALAEAFAGGMRACAIVFLHGYRFPLHENIAAECASAAGFRQISVSHRVSPSMKLVGRGDTTVVDAYLSPVLGRYVDRVAASLGSSRLYFMQSHGGLAEARHFHGKDSVLSGPAGGIVGAVRSAAEAGYRRIVTFDMGGTSTDVAHYDGTQHGGALEMAYETEVAGQILRSPALAIRTVAAGGGSICGFDGARYRVGPESAGADPGPACYRRGGPLAITDCNLLVGKIVPEYFPKIFGPCRDLPLDREVVARKFDTLARDIAVATGKRTDPAEVADGFIRVAVENMAAAIKRISIERGHDVRRYALQCFGGAGGQHACLVADALGITEVLIHPLAGVLSAYGMGLAELRWQTERALEAPLDESLPEKMAPLIAELDGAARQKLIDQGADPATVAVGLGMQLRYAGSDTALPVPLGTVPEMAEAFARSHRQRFGFTVPGRALIAESVVVEAASAGGAPANAVELPARSGEAIATAEFFSAGAWRRAPVWRRTDLAAAQEIVGPAIVIEANATTVIEPGWGARVAASGDLILKRGTARADRAVPISSTPDDAPDPVLLEIFNNRFMSIAEQMGAVLASTALSVNIKERHDFSCAVFDDEGRLIANAPHIPVHLGSMGESVRAILRARAATMRAGDAFVLNTPYNGGTHLPDVTAIAPVFGPEGLRFFVAARGHHADIGGLTPGSMPPDSRNIEDEGVLIDDFCVLAEGRLRESEMRALLSGARYPARNPDQNLADLGAQIAANEKGALELVRLADEFGLDRVRAYMRHVRENAAQSVRSVIDRLGDGEFGVEMDNGAKIAVAIRVDRKARRALIDFAGTSAQLADNFNAPSAIVHAAVLYVFRTLVDRDIPLNEGCLDPLEIRIPPASMISPAYPAAVVAGNVETSQAIVDALYGALGVVAASQGTMNNVTFGDARHQYYETLCGGSGAGPDFDGADAVHTHMTNTRLTDPEILEWRFPVLVEEFSIRRGSGGAGHHRGGDGIRRKLRFRAKMVAAVLSGRRRTRPYGAAGGEPGAAGRNWIERADGRREELGGVGAAAMEPGDALAIETPGGGGYGSPIGTAT